MLYIFSSAALTLAITIPFILAAGLIGLFLFVFWFQMLVRTIQVDIKHRILWIILIFFGQFIGATIFYFTFYKPYKKRTHGDIIKPEYKHGLRGHTFRLSLVVFGILLVPGIAGAVFTQTVSPISHTYALGSLATTYTLTGVETCPSTYQIDCVHLSYQKPTSEQGVRSDVEVYEFEKTAAIFSPPTNCGLAKPESKVYSVLVKDRVVCSLAKQVNSDSVIYASTGVYSGAYANKDSAANYYIVYKTEVITVQGQLTLDDATNIVTSLQPTNLTALRKQVKTIPTDAVVSETYAECLQKNPNNHIPNVVTITVNGEVSTTRFYGVILSSVQSQGTQPLDGLISDIKPNVVSGSMLVFVPEGTEASAIQKLRAFPEISSADYASPGCEKLHSAPLKVAN
ncbi:MAG TPA: hypothetical protein VLF90_02460 [Patescibacteria group bacterium]|nr:hypothetical protein [Patescibacteria group bacterium]